MEREVDLQAGGDSILMYEQWLETRDDALLREIQAYNAEDCESTRLLRDWLLELRPDEIPWPEPPQVRETPEVAAETAELQEQLLAREDPVLRLAGHLLDYHRREAKPLWWAFFAREGRTPEELAEFDVEAIGGIEPAGGPVPAAKSLVLPVRLPGAAAQSRPGRRGVRSGDARAGRPHRVDRRRRGEALAEARREAGGRAAASLAHSGRGVEHGRAAGGAAAARAVAPGRNRPVSGAGGDPAPRPPARRRLAAAAGRPRGGERPRRVARLELPRRPGTARLGQDVHRRAADRAAALARPARGRDGAEPQGDPQPARGGREGRADGGRRVPRAEEGRRATRGRSSRPRTTRRTSTRPTTTCCCSRGLRGSSRASRWKASSTRCSWTRRGSSRSRTRWPRGRARGTSCFSATSSSSRRSRRGSIPRAPAASVLEHLLDGEDTVPPDRGLFLSDALADARRRSAGSSRRCPTRAGCTRCRRSSTAA